ncbi:sugar-phosphatase [Nakamurella panacisegetis]|uniref:Sugar-phosphatase n=1 Tax=Nakamurella panacisegetis TaxID=1090615 RepID=A0A1H0JSC2_9ACTN|nr:HAD-IA family hydrolase [Nakamurella panacisegetis]SDO46423.1 sugar-phosphatase [Nakamurella panacisegetis]
MTEPTPTDAAGRSGPAISDRTFDAVLFDMDGTLVDSTPAVERSWAIWSIEYGMTRSALEAGHGQPASQLVRSLVADHQVDEAMLRIAELELADVHDITILPGAAELLSTMPADRVAIVTSATRALATARIAAAGLTAPAVVVTFDDVSNGKPDPEPFLIGAARLGVDPARCLVVEDAPAGIAAGRAAGCMTLAVTTTSTREELDADLVVDRLTEVSIVRGADGYSLLVG